jgi:hypothetical protein
LGFGNAVGLLAEKGLPGTPLWSLSHLYNHRLNMVMIGFGGLKEGAIDIGSLMRGVGRK